MTTLPTALIAEDEPLLRAQLKARLAEAWPELRIVAEAENGEEALAAIVERKPDVAFLDIRMPVRSGLDVARELAGMTTSSSSPRTTNTRSRRSTRGRSTTC